METLNKTLRCTGECPDCPVASLGPRGIDAVNDVVSTYYEGDHTGTRHDDFDEVVAGIAADAAIAHGLDRENAADPGHPLVEHAPAIAAGAQMILQNECAIAQQ